LKPVAPFPAPELATGVAVSEDTTAQIDPVAGPSSRTPAAQAEPATEAATAETAEPEVHPTMPEPLMIDPSLEEPGGTAAAPNLG
jgi:hypothetical protein